MSGVLLPFFVAVPLLAAGLVAAARERSTLARTVLVATLVLHLAASAWLVATTADGTVVAHGVAGWPAGIAIPFVGDVLSGLMLLVTGLLTLVCSWFAFVAGTGDQRLFPALVLVLTAGVNGALLTADLFNLFVFIEVMLLPSYGLLVLAARARGTLRSVVGSRVYVTFNLFVSTVLLAGVALTYGTAGTVNLAELAGAAQESDLTAFAIAMVLFALAMKAACVPTHGWLARTYPTTSPAVTAMFSGLHTKVAIYAIYRVYAVTFDGDERWLWIGAVVFSATMLIGVLGAVGEGTMRSILAFHMVSQIGYILVGVALFTLGGLAAGLFYQLHHMVVKASLFLSAGAVEERHGSDRLGSVKGVARRDPLLAVAFLFAALSLAGLPPFSGFVAKLTLVVAAVDAGQVAVAVVAVLVSLVTLLSMLKIWNAVFVSRDDDGGDAEAPGAGSAPGAGGRTASGATGTTEVATAAPPRVGFALTAPALVLALVTLGLGLGAQGLLALTTVAAEGLLDPSAYVEAVLR